MDKKTNEEFMGIRQVALPKGVNNAKEKETNKKGSDAQDVNIQKNQVSTDGDAFKEKKMKEEQVEQTMPVFETPANQVDKVDSFLSDDLNKAVAEETAADNDTVSNGEPKDEAVVEETAADNDTVSNGEPTAEAVTASTEEAKETSDELANEAAPEQEAQVEVTNTVDEAEEVSEDVVDPDWDEETRNLMKNADLRKITRQIKGEFAKECENQLQIGMLLKTGSDSMDEKSFRTWLTKVIDMDLKRAYELRSIAKFCEPLLTEKQVTLPYLYALGMSRLTTVSRFPKNDRRVDAEQGKILISNGNGFIPAETLSVEKIREMLQNVKNAQENVIPVIQLYLDNIMEECGFVQACAVRVENEKDNLLPQVKDWHQKATDTLEKTKKRRDDMHKTYMKNLTEKEIQIGSLQAEVKKAELWLNILNDNYYDEVPGSEKKAAQITEDAADIERRKAAEEIRKLAASA